MKKLILAGCLTAVMGVFAFAQSSSDYKKSEFYVGYSNGEIDNGINSSSSLRDFFKNRTSFNGWEGSGVYNLNRYFGLKGDVSGTYNNKRIAFTTASGNVAFDSNNSLYNFLGGVQVKDNSDDTRFKPWAHALVGAGHGRTNIKNVSCSGTVDCTGLAGTSSETGWAGAFGGGVDVKLSDKLDLRAIQVDYNPIRFSGQTQQNVRLGIGIVFK